MKTNFTTIAATLLPLMFAATVSIAQQPSPSAQAPAGAGTPSEIQSSSSALPNSKVRIVRLSEVKGSVKLDRNTGRGFETAMMNLPITEGARLQTDSGLAEVEFEDNSTLRMAPNTLIEFPRLALLPSGAKASTVILLKGTVYASLANTRNNEFTVNFGPDKLTLPPSSHVRLQMEPPAEARLSVLDGNVQVEQSSGATAVGKKKTLTFDLASQSQPTLAKNVVAEQYDSWDKNAVEYHKSYANSSAYGGSPYSYGINDMNYYGNFMNAAGCGSMWRPYFVSAGWDPFSNGAWAWYPGAGYSWVSPYPWGWTPYHYGSWNFCSGVGWGWQPGGSWMGLANVPSLGNGRGGIMPPRPPRQPPLRGSSTLLVVNLKPIAASNLNSREAFVFRNDSAGLGIPRGIGKLRGLSAGVERHGSVSVPVEMPSFSSAAGTERTANARSSVSRESENRSAMDSVSRSASNAPSYSSSEPSGGHGSSSGGSRTH